MRILLVEELQDARETVIRRLFGRGHVVVGCAVTPDQAVTMVRLLDPDVCVVDVGDRAGSGLESLRRIVAVAPGARIVACTGAGYGPHAMEAIHAGALHVVTNVQRLEHALDLLAAPRRGSSSVPAVTGAWA